MEVMVADQNGLAQIGFLLGGGAKQMKQQAYDEGRLNTAKTEDALAQARLRQSQATAAANAERAKEKFKADYIATESIKPGADPKKVALDAEMIGNLLIGGTGADYHAVMQGFGEQQDQDFRRTLADPEAPQATRFAAGEAVQGKVLPQFDAIGAGSYSDMKSESPTVASTPLGESMIDENAASAGASTALENLRDEHRVNPARFQSPGAAAGPGGVKPSDKYMLNPDYDPNRPADSFNNPQVIPVTGGEADPNTKGRMGVRERQVVARVVTAGLNTANDLENIMRLPSGVSTGILGTGLGASPGISLLDATAGNLKYSLSDSEVRDYQRILGGLTNQMLTLERMGMQGTQGQAAQYEALALRPGDTVEDKMMSMALMRQTTENGLQTITAVNPIDEGLRANINGLLARMAKAVPFTVQDVEALKYGKNPATTLGGMAAASQKAAGVAPSADEAAQSGTEIPETIQPGFRYTDPEDGREWEYGGPEPGTREQQAKQENWYPVAR